MASARWSRMQELHLPDNSSYYCQRNQRTEYMSLTEAIIMHPIRTSAEPVAQVGMDANIGAKKIEMKNAKPVTIAVIPVFPPSDIPAPDSMNAVTGLVPRRLPIEMETASTTYATADPSKSPVFSSRAPQNRAIEYKVPVTSRISTYKNVIKASAN